MNAEEVCTICFDNKPFVSLPCECKLAYCQECWNCALAASVMTRGKAQCPSCRTALSVDFDTATKGLVYSKESEGTDEWMSRLHSKAKPIQIHLLEDFAVNSTGAPSCVCGSWLECVDKDESIHMLTDTPQGTTPDITCNLCDQHAMGTGRVWTCKTGSHTVLHPTGFDVCDGCFARYGTKLSPGEKWAAHVAASSPMYNHQMDGSGGKNGCKTYCAKFMGMWSRQTSA